MSNSSASPRATARTGCERGDDRMRWLLVFLVSLILFNGLANWLRRIGLGRLPGDFTLRWRGREFHVPLASSLVLSFIAMAIGAFL